MGFQESYDRASREYENREPKWSDEYSAQWKAYGNLTMAHKEKICARFLEHVGGWELYSESTNGGGHRLVEYCNMLKAFSYWLDGQPEGEIC